MRLKTQQFIEKKLAKAEYQYDEETKQWVGWIKGLPGIYAQGESIERVRDELAEILEEYLYVSIREKKAIPGFNLNWRLKIC